MRISVAFCLILLVTAVNGGALTLALSLDEGASASSRVAVEWTSTQTVLEDCCDVDIDKVLPRSVAPCAADCSALVPAVTPNIALNKGQGSGISSYALTEGPGQTWRRPPRV